MTLSHSEMTRLIKGAPVSGTIRAPSDETTAGIPPTAINASLTATTCCARAYAFRIWLSASRTALANFVTSGWAASDSTGSI